MNNEESICERCGRNNPLSWSAESPLWNEVMRDGDIDSPDLFGFICPNCFMELAILKGVANRFHITSPHPLVPLKNITPSGRVWNSDTFLWE